jgi:hypothetical protein
VSFYYYIRISSPSHGVFTAATATSYYHTIQKTKILFLLPLVSIIKVHIRSDYKTNVDVDRFLTWVSHRTKQEDMAVC